MSGTKIGGLRARETNIKRHGEDFYRRIGAIGGRNGHTGGFAANIELAKLAGAKGGRISRRTGVKNGEGKTSNKDIDRAEQILEEESERQQSV